MNWRHRSGLIVQWNRVNIALLSRQLDFMYGGKMPPLVLPKEDLELVPDHMTKETVAQAAYRFLNSIGNPVELSRPEKICQTQQFFQYAISSDAVIDPTLHPCLHSLPDIFFRAMKGISAMVDAYLGIPKASQLMALSRSSSSSTANQQQTQAGVSFVTASSALLVNAVTGTLPEHQSVEPSLVRPKCSSILHLFGPWLFE